MHERIEGKVARIVSADELIINRGSRDGVSLGMIFWVQDPRVLNVLDPTSGEALGSIDRPLAKFKITHVEPAIALGVQYPSHGPLLSSVQAVIGGAERRSKLSEASWPEGVRIGDAVVWRGELANQGPSALR